MKTKRELRIEYFDDSDNQFVLVMTNQFNIVGLIELEEWENQGGE